MADNTEQYEWLVKIKENLEILFADRPDVLIAGDLLWYPVPDRRITGPVAPDVMVVFGRPKGRRGSYRQWDEDGIAPQVVLEVLSPSNSVKEMADKLAFYDLYGVEEYYLLDPEHHELKVWLRRHGRLKLLSHLNAWTSPRLGIRFVIEPGSVQLFYPEGEPFLTSVELARGAKRARLRAEQEAARAEQEAARAEQEAARAQREAARAEKEHRRAERLAERLRALGIDPDQPD